jgi:HTH-type transcriptional regulator/antitoxin MqsA
MQCPVCGAVELVSVTSDLPYVYQANATVIANVTGDECPVCGEQILDPAEAVRASGQMLAFNRRVNQHT